MAYIASINCSAAAIIDRRTYLRSMGPSNFLMENLDGNSEVFNIIPFPINQAVFTSSWHCLLLLIIIFVLCNYELNSQCINYSFEQGNNPFLPSLPLKTWSLGHLCMGVPAYGMYFETHYSNIIEVIPLLRVLLSLFFFGEK